jgi:hypothetical protein
MNTIRIWEAVVAVGGTIWIVTVILELWLARHLYTGRLSDLFHPTNRDNHFHRVFLFTVPGWLGAMLVGIITIGIHIGQAIVPRHSTYVDSIGPPVQVNFTATGKPEYWGNATSWSDCFTLTSPTSSNGFWHEWFQIQEVRLERLIALL